MAAALELFALNGFHSTSVDAVAGKAGVSKGLIYNYFQTKDELLETVIFEKMDQIEKEFLEKMQSADPRELLEGFITTALGMVESDPGYWRFYWSMIMHPRLPDTIMRKVMDSYRTLIGRVGMLLRMNGIENPELEARVLLPTLDAITMMHLLDPELFSVEEMRGYLTKKYCG